MRTSQRGIDIIKRWEGVKLVAYFCPANVSTIGIGHTRTVTRAWRTSRKGRWPGVLTRPLIDGLFFVVTWGRDRNHCRDAYDSEHLRRQFPDHYRG